MEEWGSERQQLQTAGIIWEPSPKKKLKDNLGFGSRSVLVRRATSLKEKTLYEAEPE
jgi:hypothetical protein